MRKRLVPSTTLIDGGEPGWSQPRRGTGLSTKHYCGTALLSSRRWRAGKVYHPITSTMSCRKPCLRFIARVGHTIPTARSVLGLELSRSGDPSTGSVAKAALEGGRRMHRSLTRIILIRVEILRKWPTEGTALFDGLTQPFPVCRQVSATRFSVLLSSSNHLLKPRWQPGARKPHSR